jgi:hypothetical protein
MKTTVVNKHHKVPYDIYIGRGSIWGNPFTDQPEGTTKAKYVVETREEAIEKYRIYIEENIVMIKRLKKLKGKTLACYCKPKQCHGDVLVELIEKYYGDD